MCAVKVGKLAKVTVGTWVTQGTYVVAEQGTYSLSGFSRDALDSTSFGDDVKEYTFGLGDAGEVTFSGNYDPTADAAFNAVSPQEYLRSCCSNGLTMTSGHLRFYIDSTSYMTVGGAGTLLLTKVHAIGFDKAGIGTISFTAKVSGGAIVTV